MMLRFKTEWRPITNLWLTVTLFVVASLIQPGQSLTAQEIVIDQPVATYTTHAHIYKVSWHLSGQFLAVATNQGMQIFDDALQPITQLYSTENIYALSWSPDGSQLAVTHALGIEIWQWDSQSTELSLMTILENEQQSIAVEWSPDGNRIASLEMYRFIPNDDWSWVGTIHIWQTSPFESEKRLDGTYNVVFSQEITVNHRIVWSTIETSTLIINWCEVSDDPHPIMVGCGLYDFNVENEVLTHIVGNKSYVTYSTAVAIDPTGALFALGTSPGVAILDSSTGELVNSFDGWDVRNVDWSPNGNYLAGDSNVYDINQPKQALGYFQRTTSITAIDWHPNSKWLAIADYDGLLKIEDATLLPGFIAPE